MITPERLAESVTETFWALRRASVGSCDCNAKSPDPDVHAERCDYRHIKNAERGLVRLQSDLSAAQKRIQTMQDVIRVALRDTVLGAGTMRAMLEDCLND